MNPSGVDVDASMVDWVIDYPESLAVFNELGIDYCCAGKSLEFACREAGADFDHVCTRLRNLVNARAPSGSSMQQWEKLK